MTQELQDAETKVGGVCKEKDAKWKFLALSKASFQQLQSKSNRDKKNP